MLDCVPLPGDEARDVALLRLASGQDRTAHSHLQIAALDADLSDAEMARHQIARMLHDAYPGQNCIEPMMPDLLGEHLLQVELGKDEDDQLLTVVSGPTAAADAAAV
jgi:hypothetical protein